MEHYNWDIQEIEQGLKLSYYTKCNMIESASFSSTEVTQTLTFWLWNSCSNMTFSTATKAMKKPHSHISKTLSLQHRILFSPLHVHTASSAVKSWPVTQAFRYYYNANSNKNPPLETAILKKCYLWYHRYPYNNLHCKLKMLPSHQEALEIFSATVINLGLVSLVVQTCGNEEPIQFSISVSGTLHGLKESTHKPVISDRDGHMCACPRFGNCIAASAAFTSLNCRA